MQPEPNLFAIVERLKALEDRLTEHSLVQQREILQSKETVHDTRNEIDRRLREMNEFRQQLTNERATYVTRDMLDARLHTFESKQDSTNDIVASIERKMANQEGRFWAMGVALSVAVIILNIALRFIFK